MDMQTYKQIIKFAMANEEEACRFYAEAADRVEDSYLKEMFTAFAAEEEKHRQILKDVYISNRIGEYFDHRSDFKVAETVAKPEVSSRMKPADAIALAMKNEAEAMQQYTRLAQECPDEQQRRVFLDLAAMERGHKLKMEKAFVDIGYPEVW